MKTLVFKDVIMKWHESVASRLRDRLLKLTATGLSVSVRTRMRTCFPTRGRVYSDRGADGAALGMSRGSQHHDGQVLTALAKHYRILGRYLHQLVQSHEDADRTVRSVARVQLTRWV